MLSVHQRWPQSERTDSIKKAKEKEKETEKTEKTGKRPDTRRT